jgi:hypothetical protein
LREAACAGPPSPEKPAIPLPANVLIVPMPVPMFTYYPRLRTTASPISAVPTKRMPGL